MDTIIQIDVFLPILIASQVGVLAFGALLGAWATHLMSARRVRFRAPTPRRAKRPSRCRV
jgi:hypothetical protein